MNKQFARAIFWKVILSVKILHKMNKTGNMRDFYVEFIALYRSKPELWKVKSEEYKNKELKAKAYDVLIKKFREIGENVDKDFVKKKINSLRTSYRRELRKSMTGLKSGEEYMSTLWHFKYLHFLREQEEALEDFDDAEGEQQQQPSAKKRIYYESNKSYDDHRTIRSKKPKQYNDDYEDEEVKTKKLRDKPPDSVDLLRLASQCIKQSNDETSIMARGWAYEYDKLSLDQQIFAKKAINDVLFEARLGTLHRHSVKINQEPNKYGNTSTVEDTKIMEFEYEETE